MRVCLCFVNDVCGFFLVCVMVFVVFLNSVSFWICIDTFPWEKGKHGALE